MKRIFATLTALALSSGVALAGEMGYSKSDMSAGFGAADKDSDGVLTMEEANSVKGLTEAYDDVDANADGTIDKSEFSAFEIKQAQPPAVPESKD
jgi:hypothetical protein